MNTITNKILQNESNVEKVNSIVDSFFAGCLKYDLYELARRFTQINTRDLFTYQQLITNPAINADQLSQISSEAGGFKTTTDSNGELAVEGNTTQGTNGSTTPASTNNGTGLVSEIPGKYVNLGWYFHNDIPPPRRKGELIAEYSWKTAYNSYISISGTTYATQTPAANKDSVNNTFKEVVGHNAELEQKFRQDVVSAITQDNTIKQVTITLVGSASRPATIGYNESLSSRRIDSVLKWFKEDTTEYGRAFQKFIDEGKIVIIQEPKGEEEVVVVAKETPSTESVNCTDQDDSSSSNNWNTIFSYQAMWCRRVAIKEIKFDTSNPQDDPSEKPGDPGTNDSNIVPFEGGGKVPFPGIPVITPPTITTTSHRASWTMPCSTTPCRPPSHELP